MGAGDVTQLCLRTWFGVFGEDVRRTNPVVVRVSVVLPCYNAEDTLRVQLDALASQVCEDGWELVFVDNGSTDGSLAIVEEYRNRFSRLEIVHAHAAGTVRKGAVHSYRCGVERALGDAFVFCDADDEVGEGWLEAMARALERAPFVMCRVDLRRLNSPDILDEPGAVFPESGPLRYPVAPFWEFGLGGSLGFTRQMYEKLGSFDPRFSVAFDMDYCFRAQQAGTAITPVRDAVMHYRLRTTPRATFRQRRSYGREFAKVGIAHGANWGRFPRARAMGKLSLEVVGGASVLIDVLQRSPRRRRSVYQWSSSMGFAVGLLEGMPAGAGLRAGPDQIPAATFTV
jgi:glycosyltransferase involved in cell wall biosynthesis